MEIDLEDQELNPPWCVSAILRFFFGGSGTSDDLSGAVVDVEVDVDNGIASTPDKSLVLEGSLSNTLDVGVYVGNGKLLLEGVCAGVTTGDPRSRSNADNELVLGVFPW